MGSLKRKMIDLKDNKKRVFYKKKKVQDETTSKTYRSKRAISRFYHNFVAKHNYYRTRTTINMHVATNYSSTPQMWGVDWSIIVSAFPDEFKCFSQVKVVGIGLKIMKEMPPLGQAIQSKVQTTDGQDLIYGNNTNGFYGWILSVPATRWGTKTKPATIFKLYDMFGFKKQRLGDNIIEMYAKNPYVTVDHATADADRYYSDTHDGWFNTDLSSSTVARPYWNTWWLCGIDNHNVYQDMYVDVLFRDLKG